MILFYAAEEHLAQEYIHHLMVEYQFNRPVMPFNSLESLESRLRRPHHDIDIILIYIGDAIEMVKLTQMRPLLIDLRILMVLPCHDPDMVAWAHRLGPRFIAYADNGGQLVGSVLEKMLGKNVPNKKLLDFNHYRQKRL